MGVLMAGDGFNVNATALTDAGQGIADLMKMLGEHKVEDIDCDAGAVGHEGLAGQLESFCGRWQVGVENLLEDGSQFSQRLLDCAATYRGHDDAIANVLNGGSHG
jgi:hypothetical protein